jgi:type IV secretion system protein VirD4
MGLLLVFVVTSFVGATQLVAYRLGYAPALGRPLVLTDTVKVYWPWSVAVWYGRWGSSHPRVFEQALLVPLGELMLFAWAMGMGRRPRLKEIGKDCWGSLSDLKRAGLLGNAGVVVGRVGRRLLRFDLRRGHVLVVGGTRSGKTVGVIVPSLLSWPSSVVVFDPKGELWRMTAGFRATFSHCVYFNPTLSDSVKYNPLLEVRRGCEIRDAQNAAVLLADPAGVRNQFDIWDTSASQLVAALILHVLYTAEDNQKHLGTVRDLLLDFDQTCELMMTTPHRLCPQTGEPQVHPEVMLVAKSLTAAADRFRSSVVATAESYLTLFADPIVRDNVSRSDLALGA